MISIADLLRVLGLVGGTGRIRVLALLSSTLVMGLMPGLQVYLTARIVQEALSGAITITSATVWVLLLVCTFGAVNILGSVSEYLSQVVQLRLSASISTLVMKKGAALELSDFETSEVYDMLQRAFQESSGARVHLIFSQSMAIIRQLTTLGSVSAVVISWNPWIALLLALSTLPSAWAQIKLGAKLYEVEYNRTEIRRRMLYFQTLTTQRQSVREIKLLGLSDIFVERFQTLVNRFLSQDANLTKKYMTIFAAWGMLSVVMVSVGIGWAFYDVSRTGEVGQLAGYFQAMVAIQMAASSLFSAISDVVEGGLFISNLFRLLDFRPTQIDLSTARSAIKQADQHASSTASHSEDSPPAVVFSNVGFTYPGAQVPAIDNVTFQVAAGETVAIVGENGSGKSTVMNLLLRLYRPDTGRIQVGDTDLDDVLRVDYLKRVRATLQDHMKYQLSVRDNVGFGNVSSIENDRAIVSALELSNSHLASWGTDGVDRTLGKLFTGGVDISGGEWQRVAISRSVFGEGDLVILDEPASALDPLAEERLFDDLGKMYGSATKLFVSHRFSSVRRADRIIVMSNGTVDDVGTHSELLKRGGLYRDMFETQAEHYR